VMTAERLDLLRGALADAATHVEFVEASTWYGSPSAAIRGYREFVAGAVEARAPWIRVVAEPVWLSDANADLGLWTRYESAVNLVLADAPATIVCAYDTRSVSPDIALGALRTHPERIESGETVACTHYLEPEDFLFDAER
jgi:hypothetical protein